MRKDVDEYCISGACVHGGKLFSEGAVYTRNQNGEAATLRRTPGWRFHTPGGSQAGLRRNAGTGERIASS